MLPPPVPFRGPGLARAEEELAQPGQRRQCGNHHDDVACVHRNLLFVPGIGTLVYGLAPRFAGVVAYGIIAWSFVVEIVGAGIGASRWLLAHLR
jgi:hypothetical protein